MEPEELNEEELNDELDESLGEVLVDFDDEYDEEEEDGWSEPVYVLYNEPVDPEEYASITHDSFGERYVHIAGLRERAPIVTILRVLGVMNLVPKGDVQFILNGNEVSSDHQLGEGDVLYIVGKLAGG